MPRREYVCKNPACRYAAPEVPSMSDEDSPSCLCCDKPLEVCIYPVKTIFTGVISARYNDPGHKDSHQDGHWAWGKDPKTGQSQPHFIETFDQQREFCKTYGYANPKDMPRNYTPTEDGKGEVNTRGMPGSEV